MISRDPTGLGGASIIGSCRGDDGHDYALKDQSINILTPHNEWFCTKLAGAVGVSCPQCAVVIDEKGAPLFGSRWEGGISKDYLWEVINRGDIPKDEAFASLSRILAFDNFVHNIDRHSSNYIVRSNRNGFVILAMDFDNAWLYQGFPLPSLPMHKGSNTRWFARYLKSVIGDFVLQDQVGIVLDRILQISKDSIEQIIKEHPDEWMPTNFRDQVLSWWASDEMVGRVEAIGQGIGDGTFV